MNTKIKLLCAILSTAAAAIAAPASASTYWNNLSVGTSTVIVPTTSTSTATYVVMELFQNGASSIPSGSYITLWAHGDQQTNNQWQLAYTSVCSGNPYPSLTISQTLYTNAAAHGDTAFATTTNFTIPANDCVYLAMTSAGNPTPDGQGSRGSVNGTWTNDSLNRPYSQNSTVWGCIGSTSADCTSATSTLPGPSSTYPIVLPDATPPAVFVAIILDAGFLGLAFYAILKTKNKNG